MDRDQLIKRLMVTFLGELEEHVRAMNDDLLALEKEPAGAGRAERYKSLFRAAHSLKGAARSVSVAIEEACHHLEEILGAASEAGRRSPRTVRPALRDHRRDRGGGDAAPRATGPDRLAAGRAPAAARGRSGRRVAPPAPARPASVRAFSLTPPPHPRTASPAPPHSSEVPEGLEPPAGSPRPPLPSDRLRFSTSGHARRRRRARPRPGHRPRSRRDRVAPGSGLRAGPGREARRAPDTERRAARGPPAGGVLVGGPGEAARVRRPVEGGVARRAEAVREAPGARRDASARATRLRGKRPPSRTTARFHAARSRPCDRSATTSIAWRRTSTSSPPRWPGKATSSTAPRACSTRRCGGSGCSRSPRPARASSGRPATSRRRAGSRWSWSSRGGRRARPVGPRGLKDPLCHLVRNAVDHGIEPPEERLEGGKPPEGRVTVSAALRGNEVEVVVADDGRGLDPDASADRRGSAGSPSRPTTTTWRT